MARTIEVSVGGTDAGTMMLPTLVCQSASEPETTDCCPIANGQIPQSGSTVLRKKQKTVKNHPKMTKVDSRIILGSIFGFFSKLVCPIDLILFSLA